MNITKNNKFRKREERKNKAASGIISIGGYAIIISIVAIFGFLFYKSYPLLTGASVEEFFSYGGVKKQNKIILAGLDQYKEVGYTVHQNGHLVFNSLLKDSLVSNLNLEMNIDEKIISSAKGDLKGEYVSFGTNQGSIITARIKIVPKYSESERHIIPSYKELDRFQIQATDSIVNHVEILEFCKNEDGFFIWSWIDHHNGLNIKIFDPEEDEYFEYNLNNSIEDVDLTSLAINYSGESLIVGSSEGELFWFDLTDYEKVILKDNWKVYSSSITALSFLIGDNGLAIGSEEGQIEVWFPVRDDKDEMKFTQIHTFSKQDDAVVQIFSSPRKRDFISISAAGKVQLNYSTTSITQLQFDVSKNQILTAAYSPKANGLMFADVNGNVSFFDLINHHPETTVKSLFGKVWYEGYDKPEFVWQSTGGSDEFEPKLSFIPLVFGTLKGTLYAMLFSIPLALLGAIYISQFAPRNLATIIKPSIEIMAALPSVVIGFLAGLYFSPLFEKHLMTIGLIIGLLPLVLLLFIVLWGFVPEEKRLGIAAGKELLFILPLIVITVYFSSLIANPLEQYFFAGDLKQYLYEVLGINYDQRNSLVVGFALGFAVVPIIFTIAEDALSNVPKSLSSAALALGASKWQAVVRVILPAAAGGIFAAIMLGLGRAIGETMIVLMATGNTPIIDLSPFNGFRAMSACIAVEIPEAPVDGTLYRVLFLTALLLFIFTFVINSLAGIIGDKLRKKYARF